MQQSDTQLPSGKNILRLRKRGGTQDYVVTHVVRRS